MLPTIHVTINVADPFVGQEITSALVAESRQAGHTLKPNSAETLGFGDLILQLSQNVIDNKDLLIALASLGTSIVTLLDKRLAKEKPDVVARTTNAEKTLTNDQTTNEELLRDLLADDPEAIQIEVKSRR